MKTGRMLLALVALLPGTSCLELEWTRNSSFEPIPPERIAGLEPGKADLQRCLHELGAPHFVDKGPNGSTDLVWAFGDTVAWGVAISYPLTDWYDVSFTYDDSMAALDGVLMRFDAAGLLVASRTGKLGEIVTGGRRTDRRIEYQRR